MIDLYHKISVDASKNITQLYSTSFSLGIKLLDKKICIVSPELQGQKEKISLYRQQLIDNNIIPDAICCKEYNIYEWI